MNYKKRLKNKRKQSEMVDRTGLKRAELTQVLLIGMVGGWFGWVDTVTGINRQTQTHVQTRVNRPDDRWHAHHRKSPIVVRYGLPMVLIDSP